MIKINKKIPNGNCHNEYCMKVIKGDFLYCYDCYQEINDKPMNKCKYCNKYIKGEYKQCYNCNLNKTTITKTSEDIKIY